MDLNLAGKSVLVTGGGSNIGRAITLAFAREGARVAIAEIDEAQGKKAAREAEALGATAIVVKPDLLKLGSSEPGAAAASPTHTTAARTAASKVVWSFVTWRVICSSLLVVNEGARPCRTTPSEPPNVELEHRFAGSLRARRLIRSPSE